MTNNKPYLYQQHLKSIQEKLNNDKFQGLILVDMPRCGKSIARKIAQDFINSGVRKDD